MTNNHAFKIVAVGEDFAAIMLAQELSKRLAAELKREFEISGDAWKFEALGNLQARKEAAKVAAEADVVVIAASGADEPPAHVKRWIESWLPRKQKSATALVALLDDEDETLHKSLPLCAYLRRIAGKWGMDFFSNSADWRQQYLESKAEVPHRRRKSRRPEAIKELTRIRSEETALSRNEKTKVAGSHPRTGRPNRQCDNLPNLSPRQGGGIGIGGTTLVTQRKCRI